MSSVLDHVQPNEVTSDPVVLVALGDAAALTLGQGGGGGEDKRYQYN